ncbi:MAG: UDP-glucose 4-epimerase GalE [Clostridiales bacterium]|nr:UDP-glucose 4-epimerase GalE [Clostridiales bacterium]
MKILITGGAGYIGSHCAEIFNEKGYEVIVVDNLSKGHEAAVGNAKFYKGNVGDEAFMDKVLGENKPDAVIHFAAYSLVGESMQKPYEYYKNNVCESMNLFHSLVRHDIKNVVFSSTAATYGQPEDGLITEETPNAPINTYGETKLAIEKMLKWYNNAYGLNFIALRYFNVAGAHPNGHIGEDHRPETHLIPIVLQCAQGKRERMKIFGGDYPTKDGTCVRDYIHVYDLIDAHELALKHMQKTGECGVYNLGTGGGYSNLEIVETARKVTGAPIPTDIIDRRPGDPPTLVASSENAERILGWKRRYGIEDIISHAWKWHSTHPEGYKN